MCSPANAYGFLVLRSYETSTSWGHFVLKRFLRIAPALVASLLLCGLLLDPLSVIRSMVVWLTGGLIFPVGDKNVALWSLAWEELAYLLLVLLWSVGAYRKPVAIWALLILSLGLAWLLAGLPPHHRIILFLFPAFFVGNLAYMHREALLNVHPAVPWIVFLLLLQWGATPAAAWFGGAALAVVQAFIFVWVGIAGYRLVPFKFPDFSYSAYIYHFPLITFILMKDITDTMLGLLMVLLPSLLLVCVLSWYLIEAPALKFKRRDIKSVIVN